MLALDLCDLRRTRKHFRHITVHFRDESTIDYTATDDKTTAKRICTAPETQTITLKLKTSIKCGG